MHPFFFFFAGGWGTHTLSHNSSLLSLQSNSQHGDSVPHSREVLYLLGNCLRGLALGIKQGDLLMPHLLLLASKQISGNSSPKVERTSLRNKERKGRF